MTPTADLILDALESLPPAGRVEAIAEVGSVICLECGYGSRADPNPAMRCQCWNDE